MLIFCLFAAVAGTGYYLWQKPAFPSPLPPEPRLAPAGTYFLREYVSVRTDHGITGWLPGQELHAVPGKDAVGGKRLLTDGTLQTEVPLSSLTQDIDLAARLNAADASAQTSDTARRRNETERAKTDQRKADVMRASDLEVAELERRMAEELRGATSERERRAVREKTREKLDEALRRQQQLRQAQ